MRRHTIAIIGLCAALFGLLALPGAAGAREKSLPRAVADAVSRPLDALFGSPRKVKRRSYHRRSHSRRPADVRRAAPARSKRAPQQAIIPTHQQEASKPAAEPMAAVGAAAAAANAAAPANTITPAIAPALPPEKPTAAMNRSSQARATGGRQQKPQPAVVERNPLGYVGPVSWPNAFEDVIGYIFWPRDYEQRLRNHGFGDIIAAVFRPARPPAPPPATRRGGPRPRTADAESVARPTVLGCGGDEREPADWPGRQIEQVVQLDDAQRAKLADLRAAVVDAVTSIRAACRDEVGLVPPDRMMVVQATLWAVRDAAVLIRGPLQAFYDSLSDEQKAKFLFKGKPAAPSADAVEKMRAAAMARPELSARLANSNIDWSAIAACGEAELDWPSGEIDDVIKPDAAQRASLESLQNSMMEMGQFLALQCPRPGAETPMARIDSATDRLTAMIFAASTVNLALNDFYGLLTSEQKARIAPPTR
jgi:hypothetical protein